MEGLSVYTWDRAGGPFGGPKDALGGRGRTAGDADRRRAVATTLVMTRRPTHHSLLPRMLATLRSIDGFSQALLDDYSERLDAEGKDYLKRVCESAQYMAQLIENLLMLSRVTQSDVHLERVDLSALARAAATRLRDTQPERQ